MGIKPKKSGSGLEIRTFKGKDGTYIVYRTPRGSFHVFIEVDAKNAAIDCGASGDPKTINTRKMWQEIWDKK